jgi:hypothetical protein
MQWFRHPSGFRNEPVLRATERKLGEADDAVGPTLSTKVPL